MKRAAFLTALAVLLSGCVTNARQDTLKPHGTVARQLDHLFDPVFWIAVGVFCLVAGLVTVAIFRFRARSDDEAPRQVHGHTLLELTWTILPAMLLAGIAVPTVKMVFDINRIPKKAMVINVTGHRWWWQFDYVDPSDPTKTLLTTANELHMPTKEKVVITLTSVDVIHNFWVPELAGKLYAIPGRHNRLVLEADQAGTYYGQCAEFCGTSHANMRLRAIAESPSDFRNWESAMVAGPATPASPDAQAGLQLFTSLGCAGCHTIDGISSGVVGPNLTHFKDRNVFAGAIFANNDNNLRLWLANPPAEKAGSVMPNLNLSEDQITKLIAYLDTLK
jgi:cytochrome c oxidase subunit 2